MTNTSNTADSVLPGLRYGGFCTACGKTHFLSWEQAAEPARQLMETLNKAGRLDFDVPENLSDSRCSLSPLFGPSRGQMFGVLVCRDRDGRRQELKAFSGQYGGLWEIPGWVPPMADSRLFEALVELPDLRIKELGKEIGELENQPGREVEAEALRLERRSLSRTLMAEIHGLYTLENFRGEQRNLSDFFPRGIPAGTGDCCAPKLLYHASRHMLTPLSMAEFFWGKETLSGSRRHGEFYPSCSEKCGPLLGFLLCGAQELI